MAGEVSPLKESPKRSKRKELAGKGDLRGGLEEKKKEKIYRRDHN